MKINIFGILLSTAACVMIRGIGKNNKAERAFFEATGKRRGKNGVTGPYDGMWMEDHIQGARKGIKFSNKSD